MILELILSVILIVQCVMLVLKVYTDICEKAKFFFGQMTENERPFQVAIGE